MTNDDIKHYLNHFKEKIEEAVGLVPGMSAEQKLKAVQFWNLVSERLQEIVNNSAADINALAMRMEEEKQTAQKESTNLNAMQNLHESKSVTSNKAEDCTDLRYTCNHLLEPNPTDVMPNYATNCKEEMMDGISNLDLIERNVPNADPDPNPHDKNVPQQSDNNVIRSMEQNTRRNVIQSTSQTSPAKSDTSNLNLSENIDFFSQDAQPQVNGSQPLENAEDFNANNSNNLMRMSNENSESSLSADSISFLSNDTSCESSRNLIEEQQVTQSLSETSKPSRSKTESTEAGASDQSSPQSKPYSCVECNSKFSTKGNLLVHQRRHTGEKPFGCEKCPASFSTKGNLKRHIKAHSGERPWECTMCDSKFTEKKSLKVHMRRHTGEKPYKCTICDKSFSQTGVLQTHMALHLDERKHLCEMCGKAFRQRSQLRLHVLRHEGVKRWNCPNCSAKFLTKGDLERHYRVHTGERPFVCDLCGKTFTRQQSLNEHSNRHYGLKPYSCNICNKKFAEMSACYKHIKVHKKMDAQVNMNVDTLGEKPNTSTDEGTNSNQESPSRVNVIKAAPTESSNGMSVFHDLKQLPNPQPQPTFTKEDICASIPDLDLTAINILANASTYQQTF